MEYLDEISVIIPIYNVEKYLEKCIDSVLAQTYRNIEIILVDDGSTDKCADICDSYLKKDSRVKVIHKVNGGLSSARNAGLDIAEGDFISFVDSDDFIEKEMLEKLYEALMEADADMAVCNFRWIDTNGARIAKQSKIVIHDGILDESAYWRKVYEPNGSCYVVAWNKLYRRSIWEKLRYPEGKINEDEYVLHEILRVCNKVSCISYVGYNYIIREDSIMASKMKRANFDVLDAWFLRIFYFEKNCNYDEIKRQLSECCVELLVRYHTCRTKEEKERFQKYVQEYKVLYDNEKNRDGMPLKERIKTIGCEYFPGIMNLIARWLYWREGLR